MRLLESFLQPWLGPLIRQRAVCRALLALMTVLTIGAWNRWKLWSCIFADVTGLPCPGCGMTRAATALLHGDWRAAVLYHPFSPLFAVLGVFVLAGAFLPAAWAGELAGRVAIFERRTRLTALFLGGLLCFSLLRMLGFWYQPPLSGSSPFLLIRKAMAAGKPSQH